MNSGPYKWIGHIHTYVRTHICTDKVNNINKIAVSDQRIKRVYILVFHPVTQWVANLYYMHRCGWHLFNELKK